jgi:hypothetical protein
VQNLRNPDRGEPQQPASADYKFKQSEFARMNRPVSARGPFDGPLANPVSASEATGSGAADVQEMLLRNAEVDMAKGWYHVQASPDKVRRRRHTTFWVCIAAVDGSLAAVAWHAGHADPVPFVFALAGMAFFTGQLTWQTWFLRTD